MHNTSTKADLKKHESRLRSLCGTFAAEGIPISLATRENLARIASGQASYQQVLHEVRSKYLKKD